MRNKNLEIMILSMMTLCDPAFAQSSTGDFLTESKSKTLATDESLLSTFNQPYVLVISSQKQLDKIVNEKKFTGHLKGLLTNYYYSQIFSDALKDNPIKLTPHLQGLIKEKFESAGPAATPLVVIRLCANSAGTHGAVEYVQPGIDNLEIWNELKANYRSITADTLSQYGDSSIPWVQGWPLDTSFPPTWIQGLLTNFAGDDLFSNTKCTSFSTAAQNPIYGE